MKLHIAAILLILGVASSACSSQVTPDMATGLSPYAVYIPSDIDNVNPANGNIFIKIPLLSYPQIGGKLRLDYYIYYNDKQWQANLHPLYSLSGSIGSVTGQWIPAGLAQDYSSPTLSAAGAYVARDQFAYSLINYPPAVGETWGTGGDSYTETIQYLTATTVTPDGATHFVGDGFLETKTCGPNVPSSVCPELPSWGNGQIINSYPATDASGFDQFGHGPDGIKYSSSASGSSVSDPSANTITSSSLSGWTDTYHRLIPGTMSGPGFNQFPNATGEYIAVPMGDLIPGLADANIPSQCPGGTSAARYWTVPASESYGDGSATYYLCYSYLSYQTAFDLSTVLPPQSYPYSAVEGSSSIGMGQALMLTAVVLPDLNSYTFSYDGYLSLTQLGLPSGGSISYSWQNVVFNPYPAVVGPSSELMSPGGMVTPVSRALLTRTVTPNDGQPSITTTYHWYITLAASGVGAVANGVQFPAYSVVTDSNGNDTEYTLGGKDDAGVLWPGYVITGTSSYAGCGPHDSACTSGTGTRLKSVTYALTATVSGGAASNSPAFTPQLFTIPPTTVTQSTTHIPTAGGDILSTVKSTLAPGYGTCTVYSYPSFGSPSPPTLGTQTFTPCYSTGQAMSTSTYDFSTPGSRAPGSLLKTEYTSYAWQPTVTAGFPSNFTAYPGNATYLAANLLNLAYQNQARDGGNNFAAETDNGYDESPSPSGARGNQTSVSRYVNSGSKVTSTVQYNSNGVATMAADPMGNQTSYSGFLCNSALPQTVKRAYGSTTTTPETTTYSYDCNTGKVLTVQDPNLWTTTYTYSDPLSRVSAVSYPDGGGVSSVIYSDVASPNTFPITMKVTTLTGESAGPAVTTATYDGLARKTLSQGQTSSLSSVLINTATNYDNMGRAYQVSNPYYTGETANFTTYLYDALSRKTSQTDSDGVSTQGWDYNGATVTYTDENQNQWQRTTDALGRLIRVLEPDGTSGASSIQTNYGYDALNDLLSVVQWGGSSGSAGARIRSFSYDSLSRLTTASNPESGTNLYSYLLGGSPCAGNMSLPCSKTDARGVMTSFTYDALNRALSKTYSSADASKTPYSCYQYDSTSVTNGKGRLARAWTQSASQGVCASTAPTTGFWTKRSILAYDKMGRVLSEQQYTPSNRASTTPYALTYTYDLAGNLLTSTNGTSATPTVGTLSFTNTVDSMGRLLTLNSNWNDATHPSTLFSLPTSPALPCTGFSTYPYAAFGGLMNATLGTDLTLNRGYDNRLRTTCEMDKGSIVGTATSGAGTVTVTGSEQSK